ncbi:hypothetical protein [Streptomyces sp. NPDC051662]|uniref:hypothetical protein n=1 Tax=Streptomyces sp. NPDC051662 TaxID=3154750 RepID=UPI00341CC241
MSTTAISEITDEDVLSTLRKVVAERPEYVYSAPEHMGATKDGSVCFYVHKDEDGTNVAAGCVIGVVLHRLGIPLDELEKQEGENARDALTRLVPALSRWVKEDLNRMQMHQDNDVAWGLAHAMAVGETI